MKRLELDLAGVTKRKVVKRRLQKLVDFPKWDAGGLDDWLTTVAAHQGAVPHLQSDTSEGFTVALVNSSAVPKATIMYLVRFVVRINRAAVDLDLDPPFALSIE